MKNFRKMLVVIATLACALSTVGVAGKRKYVNISGVISSTVTITQDSQLVGDVTCAVPLSMAGPNACIAFGADHIKLRLNGHTITGPVEPPANCSLGTDSAFGVGVLVDGRTDVQIDGPGVIQKFERWGILLRSSTYVTVRKITVYRNCWSGIQTDSLSDSTFERDFLINNALGAIGCGGICVFNSNRNAFRGSIFHGNGTVDYPSGNLDFGIGFEGSSRENRVEWNSIGGNTNGVLFFNTASDNVVRDNIIAGNPPAQVLKTFVLINQQGADIAFRSNFAGADNRIERNFCLTYIGPGTPPCPNVSFETQEHKHDDKDEGEELESSVKENE